MAYLKSSNPREEKWDSWGVVPGKVKSLERRTEGWRVGMRDKDTDDSDRFQEDSESSRVVVMLRGSGSV